MARARTLFLTLAASALLLLLQQPLCQAAHPQAHHATEQASCCADAGPVGGAKVLDVALDSGARPPAAASPVFAYLAAAAPFLVAAARFASAVPPPRSFYARSARILR